jgi:hypothetical protein
MPGNFGRSGFLLIAQSQSFALRHPASATIALPNSVTSAAGNRWLGNTASGKW